MNTSVKLLIVVIVIGVTIFIWNNPQAMSKACDRGCLIDKIKHADASGDSGRSLKINYSAPSKVWDGKKIKIKRVANSFGNPDVEITLRGSSGIKFNRGSNESAIEEIPGGVLVTYKFSVPSSGSGQAAAKHRMHMYIFDETGPENPKKKTFYYIIEDFGNVCHVHDAAPLPECPIRPETHQSTSGGGRD